MPGKQTLFNSFGHAFSGMFRFFAQERNGKIHLLAAVVVVSLSFALNIAFSEWTALLLCIGLVMSLEMLNAAIEKLCDHVHSERHPAIKAVKDISAGAVLWAAIISAVIGAIIFIPKILALV